MDNPSPSFFARNEFLIRRLHSLTGLVPVGAYMAVHLATNASVNAGAETFQKNVFMIHGLGNILPVVEWAFIFLPILFHGIVGLAILRESQINSSAYPLSGNLRYTLQRATGMIAFLFIAWHVFHMHGWIHAEWWMETIKPLGGGLFRPYNATSTAAEAMQASPLIPLLYAIGVLACVFHLANGMWTMGITWGVWITPAAQKNASWFCGAIGVVLAIIGLGAIGGFLRVDPAKARVAEDRMYEANVISGNIQADDHKRAGASHDSEAHDHDHDHGDMHDHDHPHDHTQSKQGGADREADPPVSKEQASAAK